MKAFSHPSSSQRGSVLIITVCLAFVIGLSLISYLLLVQSQNKMVFRSQQWNIAMAHAEAGIEEGLSQLNVKFGTNNIRSANGWGGPNGGLYGPVTRNLSGGSYSVVITTDLLPWVYSTGYARVPIGSQTLSRTVAVRLTTAATFAVGMSARSNIVLKGNNVYIDSFDSADPNYSTNGLYDPTPGHHKAGGDIASSYGLVSVQNADIKGKLLTGPTAPLPQLGNGSVGDLNWNTTANPQPGNIQPGWYQNDFNAEYRPVDPPYDPSTGWTPSSTSSNVFELGSANYTLTKLQLKNNDKMYVSGNATLYVTGDVDMSSSSTINIAPGASLKIYVGGANAVFARVNASGSALTFQYYGLPTNTSLTWNGNDLYLGQIYAPQATFNLGGGGNNVLDYQGACVVDSVNLNGHFNFHFDENLKKRAPPQSYKVASWQEL